MPNTADKLRKAREEMELREKQEKEEKRRKAQEKKDIEKQQILPVKVNSEKILMEISDPLIFDAIRFAVSKCNNLFKSEKFDNPSGSVFKYKKIWKDLILKNKWSE